MKTKSHSQQTKPFEKLGVSKDEQIIVNDKVRYSKDKTADISKEQELRLCCQCEARGCMYGYEQSRKDAIEEVNKIIDSEIKDEGEAEQRRNTRYWTYQQELRYLKDKIKKELQ
jgi:hypothetical protein